MTKSNPKREITTGNAVNEGKETRGWFVGAFIQSQQGLQTSSAVEIKWGHHPAGEERTSKATEGKATSLSLLIYGRFGITFDGQEEIILSRAGDYAMYTPNMPHATKSYAESLVITIRWPSLSNSKN